MSKLQNKETIDTWLAHNAYHQEYHNDCSSCYKEAIKIQAWKTVNVKKLEEELGITNESKLKNNYGDNYPTGYRPE